MKNSGLETSDGINKLSDSELESANGGDKIKSLSTGTVFVYDTPHNGGGIIGSMRCGDMLEYGGETKFNHDGNPEWSSVIIDGRIGWVLAKKTSHRPD